MDTKYNLFASDIDECLSLPCHNNGTCDDQINGYTCTCRNGFTGTNCETGEDLFFIYLFILFYFLFLSFKRELVNISIFSLWENFIYIIRSDC